jgi:hydrogenase-4 membrane subunit HyfE
MAQKETCQGCDRQRTCQQTYARLGSTNGSSVAIKALTAFLLPLFIFIVSLAIFQKIFHGFIKTEILRTLPAFLLALAVTMLFMSVIRLAAKRTRNKG